MAKTKKSEHAQGFEQFAAAPADAIKKSMKQAMALSGQFGELSRDGLEAVGQSAKATAAGIEAMNSRTFAFMKTAMDRNIEAMTALTGAKSIEDFTAAQSAFATSSMQTMMAEFNELSELFSDTVRNAAAPLNAQAGSFAEKIQSAG
jgi:phasin family protein